MKTKVELRVELKQKIALIDPDALIFRSKKLSENLKRLLADLEVIQKNLVIGCFSPIQSEPLWYLCLDEKIQDLSSFACVVDGEMVFKKNRLDELIQTKDFGVLISTPRAESQTVRPDVFLVPGLGFGLNGHRLGRGKGYYDKYLVNFNHQIKIGLCFEEQVFPEMVGLVHDVRMNFVVTDHGIYKIKI